MKKLVVSSLLLLFFTRISLAQTNTWTGGASGNWSSNSSWSLGHFPTSVEDVVIATNTTINVDVFVSQFNNIRSLQITGGVTVTLGCSINGTRTLQLSSTAAVTKGLNIETGNTLIMDATNTGPGTGNWYLGLTGAGGVTGIINGTLEFAGTGSGPGGARLDVYAGVSANAALVVSATGSIIYRDDTGNTASAAGPYFTMQAGAVYEIQKNGGSFPDGNWDAASIAKATNTGTNPPTFLGSSYGQLEINLPGINVPLFFNKNISFTTVNLISTGADVVRVKTGTSAGSFTLTINGNLTVAAPSILETSGNTTTSGGAGIIVVRGHIINNGIIRENSTVTGNEIQLAGTTLQTIAGSGNWLGNELLFTINNAAGAQLLSPLVLPYNLALTNGKINTDAVNLLTMIDNTTYTGGSVTSFIDGPMKKIGDDSFIFPIGTGSIFAPLAMVNVSGQALTDEFTAMYNRTNPQSVHGTAVQGGQDHVSSVEYWTLNHSGAATKQIALAVNYTSFCFDLSRTYVSRWDAGNAWWSNLGASFIAGPSNPPFESGVVTGTTAVTSYGDFTLITDLPPVLNPLPIRLIDFTAVKNNSGTATISWQLETPCTADARFEVQHSTDGNNFHTIQTVAGMISSRLYSVQDHRLKNGVNYYRLRIKEADGKYSISRTVAIINHDTGLLLTAIWPNPVQSAATITLTTARAGLVYFLMYDNTGKLVKQWQQNAAAGNNSIPFSMESLPAGIYQLVAVTENSKASMRLVKQ